MDWKTFFVGKRVLQIGLGLLGRGVGDADFLATYCSSLTVTDLKTEDQLDASVIQLAHHDNIKFILGDNKVDDVSQYDFVIKGAGVKDDNEIIRAAHKKSVPIYMSTALFCQFSGLKTIGVTGTRGKSTTTQLIYDILMLSGTSTFLGGNIRGVSTLAELPNADKYSVAVLELDSWQLKGFRDLGISPHISVFTTFFDDHMNFYDNDRSAYLRDKTSIYANQGNKDIFITDKLVLDKIEELDGDQINSQLIVPKVVPEQQQIGLIGEHNQINAAKAVEAARALKIPDVIIYDALAQANPVPGRLQYLGKYASVSFYNDSNATTQDATLAAIRSFDPSSVVLIFGGADKELSIRALIDEINAKQIRCVVLPGSGTDIWKKHLDTREFALVPTMIEAVEKAIEFSKPDDNIILSPAFASFGLFKNEYDRSDQFEEYVFKKINS